MGSIKVNSTFLEISNDSPVYVSQEEPSENALYAMPIVTTWYEMNSSNSSSLPEAIIPCIEGILRKQHQLVRAQLRFRCECTCLHETF